MSKLAIIPTFSAVWRKSSFYKPSPTPNPSRKREEGFGDTDLYISFKDEEGDWGPSINLGDEINTEFEDIFGSVTADGKFFIYSTINLEASSANIHWVDAAFIEELKSKYAVEPHGDEDGQP